MLRKAVLDVLFSEDNERNLKIVGPSSETGNFVLDEQDCATEGNCACSICLERLGMCYSETSPGTLIWIRNFRPSSSC